MIYNFFRICLRRVEDSKVKLRWRCWVVVISYVVYFFIVFIDCIIYILVLVKL